jgi:hypothetical protein
MINLSNKRGAAALLGAIALVAASSMSASAANCSFVFSRTLTRGSTGVEVMNLQKVLNMNAATQVAASGAGSPGNETMTFGSATRAAVIKFQAANSVSPTSGLVGPLTRAKLNAMCTGTGTSTGTGTTTTTTGPISVSNGPSVNTVLVDDTVGATLGSFVFSGTGTVTGVELMRTGVSTDSTLRNVYLFDGATRLTDAASVITGGAIRFNSPNGLFSVNGSKTITVRADIGDGNTLTGATNGQIVGVRLNTMTPMGGSAVSVSGVATNNLTIAQVSNIATVSLSGSASAATVNAGVMNQTLWSRTANVGQRAVNLNGLTFKYVGSAPTDSVANIGLFVDGVRVGTGSVNSNNRVVFDMSSSPLRLNTGNRLIELRGDVVKGSNRNFEFSIENSADMMVEDSSLAGVMINVTGSQQALGGLFTVTSGTLTIDQDPAFTTTKVVGGTSNQTISKFKLQAYGEDVKVETLVVTPVLTGSTPAAAGLQNVSLFVNDAAVGSSQNWTTGNLTFNLGSSLIVPAGQSVILSVKADTKTTGGTDYTLGTISANVTSAGSVARGQSSQNTVSVVSQTGRLLTVGSASATFAKTGGFVNSVASPNTAMVKVGSYTVTAGDIEDIVVTNLRIDLSGTVPLTNVSALRLAGSDSSVIYGQPTATGNNFSMNVTVPKNTSKVFDVMANIGSAPGGNTLITTGTLTSRGAINGNSTVSPAATGATLTFNTATIPNGNITRLSTSPVSQLVVGGTTNQAIVTYNVKADNGTATIQELTFNVNAASNAVDRVTSITVGGVTKNVTAATGNVITGLNIAVPEGNSGVDVPVTVNYGTVRQPNGGVSADTTTTTGITLVGFQAISGSTQIVNTVGLSVASNLMQLVSTKPTVTINQSSAASGLSIGENKIGEVTIAADAAGNVAVKSLNFDLTLSGITTGAVSACKIVEGTSGSIAVSGSTAATCSTTAADFTFAGSGYTVAAGQSRTFSVYATIGGTLGTSGQSAVASKLEAGTTGITWDDVNANTTGGALTGANIFNYPTNSWTVRN